MKRVACPFNNLEPLNEFDGHGSNWRGKLSVDHVMKRAGLTSAEQVLCFIL